MVSSEHKADSLIAKFKEAGGTSEIDVWAESLTLFRSGYLHHRLPVSGLGNHYRDNAITHKAQRDKIARELKPANAAITDMQMRQRDVAALDAKYTKELADAKAENDALRDDVAAGRRRLHIRKHVCQSVWSYHAGFPAWITASPWLADTAERDGFTLRERSDHFMQTTGRNPEVY